MVDSQSKHYAELIDTMVALRDLILADGDLDAIARRVADLAVEAVDGAERCSVSMKSGGQIATLAATCDAAAQIDELQYETRQGPCLSSIKDFATFSIASMALDETWPIFSRRAAAETETQSLLSFVLRLGQDRIGALNLSSTRRDAFDQDDLVVGALFAAQADVVLTYVIRHGSDKLELEQLKEALASRDVIGKAVGITMASQKVDSERAFEILVRISQRTNEKLRDIAAKLVDRAGEI